MINTWWGLLIELAKIRKAKINNWLYDQGSPLWPITWLEIWITFVVILFLILGLCVWIYKKI